MSDNPYEREGVRDVHEEYEAGRISLAEAERRLWDRLPEELRERAVAHLRPWLEAGEADVLRAHIERHPDDWVTADMTSPEERERVREKYGLYVPNPFHFGAGMAIRNHLRGAVEDAELPTGNWDDYYAVAVERALGVPREQ